MSVLISAGGAGGFGFTGIPVASNINGNLWMLRHDNTNGPNGTHFHLSTDGGASWSQVNSVNYSGSAGGGTRNYGLLFIDSDDYAHVVIGDLNVAGGTYLYFQGTPNAGRTSYTWTSAFSFTSSQDPKGMVAHPEGTGRKVHLICPGTASAVYKRLNVTSGGVASVDVTTTIGSGYGTTYQTLVSIDFHHNGDGRTILGGTPHLFAAWTTGATGAGKGIRFKKATYSAGAWTWGTEREIATDVGTLSAPSVYSLGCRFDGSRVYIGGEFTAPPEDPSTYYYRLYERDVADTTTTLKASDDNTGQSNSLRGNGLTVRTNGDVYFIGVGHSSSGNLLRYRKYDRAANTLGAVTTIDDITGDTYGHACAKAVADNNSTIHIGWLTTTNGSSAPWDVRYQSLVFNQAPNAPTLTAPADGASIDRGIANNFTWTFSDNDAGNTQSAFDLRYKITTDGTWTTVSQTTSTASWTAAANTFAAGNYEWQVRTTDNGGAVGPYTASRFFTATSPPAAPTITAPTTASGVTAPNHTVTWTAGTRTGYQLRTVADASGSPQTSTVYTDTGEIVDATATSRAGSFPVNGRVEHVQLRIKNSGLWSAWASNGPITVNYSLPSTPTIALTANQSTGSITVAITNPAGGATLDYNEVWADDGLGGGYVRLATSIAANGSYTYRTPRSGYNYATRIFARAVATNTATADSAHSP